MNCNAHQVMCSYRISQFFDLRFSVTEGERCSGVKKNNCNFARHVLILLSTLRWIQRERKVIITYFVSSHGTKVPCLHHYRISS